MADQRLDAAQVGAAAEQMRRARGPQRMRREPDTDASTVILDPRAQARNAETRAIAREEERRTVAGSLTCPLTTTGPPPCCETSRFSASYVEVVTASSICSESRLPARS